MHIGKAAHDASRIHTIFNKNLKQILIYSDEHLTFRRRSFSTLVNKGAVLALYLMGVAFPTRLGHVTGKVVDRGEHL